jgi:UDP-GlcNAc3NAcA epimerase
MKIVTVLGARPQFIKASAVSRAISKHDSIIEVIIHTGQHYDANMSDVFFRELNIANPDYNLGIHGGGHGEMTGAMLAGIEGILLKEKPDLVLVYGDTNSTLAGSLAASKLHIPIAHVEAGLRSFNMKMPEEVNRILSDRLSKFLFCPTATAVNNLHKEGFPFQNQVVLQVGDVMEDAALYYLKSAQQSTGVLERNNLAPGGYNLATLHRAENTDDLSKLRQLVMGLNQINHQKKVVMPLHPRTKKMLEQLDVNLDFTTINPVGYLDMINLTSNANLILTDSGGLQKEAFFYDKFCITMRSETEWTELVDGGYNMLVGSDIEQLQKAYQYFDAQSFNKKENYFGGGTASHNIITSLLN